MRLPSSVGSFGASRRRLCDVQPRRATPMLLAEVLDLRGKAKRLVDLVGARQKPRLSARIEIEGDRLTGWHDHMSLFDVDGQLERLLACRGGDDHRMCFVRQLQWQQAILQRVFAKDVAEAERDDATNTIAIERPHGILARAAAAEIRAGEKNSRASKPRVVQHEGKIL